jgi:hypothetical protein
MPAASCITCPTNKSTHPGAIVAPRTRRSTKEVQAKREAIAVAEAFVAATRKEKIQQLAALEESMAAEDKEEDEQAAHSPIKGKLKALRMTKKDVDILMSGLCPKIIQSRHILMRYCLIYRPGQRGFSI